MRDSDENGDEQGGAADAVEAVSAAQPEAETFTFVVPPDESGRRLDAYLAAHVAGASRARIQRLIEEGEVIVDARARKPSYKLRAGETVEVELTAVVPRGELVPEDIPVEIFHEDDELLVVNKPAGMVVHPGAGVPAGTLANALQHHFRQLSTRAGLLRPGIVHRLDRETSGLIVVAKTETAHERLAEQFQLREVFKSYAALVHG
ncbi:MAG: pseudouridine synthase, partial [Pyrinomonadaceae bacterium]